MQPEYSSLRDLERKSCDMNIIMCRASYSGWTELDHI